MLYETESMVRVAEKACGKNRAADDELQKEGRTLVGNRLALVTTRRRKAGS